MASDDYYMFHWRLADLIVRDYAERRHQISDSDPLKEKKIEENKAACADELKKLSRTYFGRKWSETCENCPLFISWAASESNRMNHMGEVK